MGGTICISIWREESDGLKGHLPGEYKYATNTSHYVTEY